MSKPEMLRVYLRDGFIDRYTGKRLFFGPALRLVSVSIPEAFPYHLHGKMTECHIAHWDSTCALDHIIPLARGGQDNFENCVTTSMLTNARKANWTLDELQWKLQKPGRREDWDGLLGWFVHHAEKLEERARKGYMQDWLRAAKTVLG